MFKLVVQTMALVSSIVYFLLGDNVEATVWLATGLIVSVMPDKNK